MLRRVQLVVQICCVKREVTILNEIYTSLLFYLPKAKVIKKNKTQLSSRIHTDANK
jgi:hypothetical protein